MDIFCVLKHISMNAISRLALSNISLSHSMIISQIRDRPTHRTKAVPIGLHGNGLPCIGVGHAWQKSFDCFSWGSLIGAGTCTLLMNWLIWVFPKTMKLKSAFGNTEKVFYRVLAWSLLALYEGKWPEFDWNGQPWPAGSIEATLAGTDLAGGFFAPLWTLKQDLEHTSNSMGLQNSGSAHPCSLCDCDNRDASRPWTDFSRTAAWRATIWTAEDF